MGATELRAPLNVQTRRSSAQRLHLAADDRRGLRWELLKVDRVDLSLDETVQDKPGYTQRVARA